MGLGALIGAYQEDDSGGLRALLPLAGRTLVEYQVRCAAAVGATPIMVLVERIPLTLDQAFERLRGEGLAVIPVSDGLEAASRLEPGELVLTMIDGLAPDVLLVRRLAEVGEPAIAIVPDDSAHQQFERIDAATRWAGLSLVDGRVLGATAAMLGDWDLPSTLLRRMVQSDVPRVPVDSGSTPLLANNAGDTGGFDRRLLLASRGARNDWPSRFLLPIAEEFLTERLMDSRVRPPWLVQLALALTVAAALCFSRGWLWPALGLLLVASPLELVGDRLAALRLRPLAARNLARRLAWPAAGLALLALGWWQARHGGGWGAMVAALTAGAFAEAARIERGVDRLPGDHWLFSARGAVWASVPLALGGWWNAVLALLAIYAAASFFIIQHWRHHRQRD